MKDNLKSILFGIAALAAAVYFYVFCENFTFWIKFIPLNNVVVSILAAVIGVIAIISGLLPDKKKDENTDNAPQEK